MFGLQRFPFSAAWIFRGLNENKQGTREESKLKEDTEKTVNTLIIEENESTEKMLVDLSQNSETTVL